MLGLSACEHVGQSEITDTVYGGEPAEISVFWHWKRTEVSKELDVKRYEETKTMYLDKGTTRNLTSKAVDISTVIRIIHDRDEMSLSETKKSYYTPATMPAMSRTL